jgi:hypothetical protein
MWVEAIPTKKATDKVMIEFLEDKIITRFGVPTKITTDNAKAFSLMELSNLYYEYSIYPTHQNITPRGMVWQNPTTKIS